MGRQPNAFNKVPVVAPKSLDEVADVINRLQDRLVEALRPISENPMLAISNYRFVEVAGSPPTFALQFRGGVQSWATIAHFNSTGTLTSP